MSTFLYSPESRSFRAIYAMAILTAPDSGYLLVFCQGTGLVG